MNRGTGLAGAALTLLLGACAPGGSPPREGTRLVIWETYNDQEHALFTTLVREYAARRPGLRLEVMRLPFDGHETKLMLSMVTHTAPDICRVDASFLPRLIRSRAAVDLSPYGASARAPDLVPAAVQSAMAGGRLFGVPDQTTGVVLFYNRRLFRAAGLTDAPRTWEAFVRAARALTRDTDGDGAPDQFGFGMDNSLWWTFPFFNTFGARFLSPDGTRCLLADPAGVAALQFKVDLYRRHRVEAGAWQRGAVAPDLGFIQQKYAMILSGPWNVRRFRAAGLEFGLALIPQGPAGTSTNVGGTTMVVLRECRFPAAAAEFLLYLASPEVQVRWANSLGQVPVNLKAFPGVDLRKFPELRVFMDQMKTAIARPPVMSYPRLEEVVNREMEAALSGRKSVPEALRDAAARVERDVLRE